MTTTRIQAAHPLEPETFELVLDREQIEYVTSLLLAEASKDSGARELAGRITAGILNRTLQDSETGEHS